ncbi:hypothetical protein NQ315_016753 [Exocentrus adspersus]|uniref:Tc1-like transposase DDE domain-containing protein n=1 Tax=Exocentrus adspersus TaxID=1586481 RepID=A0AAV8VD91_9CUCU|nr:hypothetical protein NQ315_016753 [Exocentrus adspersus]
MDQAIVAYNNTNHSSTGFPPLELVFGHTASRNIFDMLYTKQFYQELTNKHVKAMEEVYNRVQDKIHQEKTKRIEKQAKEDTSFKSSCSRRIAFTIVTVAAIVEIQEIRENIGLLPIKLGNAKIIENKWTLAQIYNISSILEETNTIVILRLVDLLSVFVNMDDAVQSSLPKRRKQLDLGHLTLTEKQSIVNMYKQSLIDQPTLKMIAVVDNISVAMGVAKSTVYRTLKEYKVFTPYRGGRPKIIANFDEGTKNIVRQIVHGFFIKNELPTLDKIANKLRNEPDLPQISRSSLYTFLKEINFRYVKRNRKSILIERHDIVRWRLGYLNSIKEFRKENRPIYYLDETWVNECHSKEKVWVDNSITSRRDAFIQGLSTGLKNPSGKGKRLIVLHAGSENGFVNDALLLFEGKKSGDYHEEMNANVFENWFSEFLKKLPDNSVIVMDNASYHSRKVEKVPTQSSKKADMQAWLRSKNIKFEEGMVRRQLLDIIRQHKERYNLYVTDEMAKKDDKIVLRLPPYHCELNPIEMIWAQVKNDVAARNTTFKITDVKPLLITLLIKLPRSIGKNVSTTLLRKKKKCLNWME